MLVARRHLDLLLALAAVEGLPRALVAPGHGADEARVPWDALVRATLVLAEAVGGASALAEAALPLLPGPELTLLAQAEANIGPLHRFLVERLLPGDFPHMQWSLVEEGARGFSATARLDTGYTSCVASWLLLAATFQTLPRVFQLPDARVQTIASEQQARFEVRFGAQVSPATPGRRVVRRAPEGRAYPQPAARPESAPPVPAAAPPTSMVHLLIDGCQQRRARDQTMAALSEIATSLESGAGVGVEAAASTIAAVLHTRLELPFVCVWTAPTETSPALQVLRGERERTSGGPPSRAIPLLAGGARVGHLEVPAHSGHTEWLEAASGFLAAELSRSAQPSGPAASSPTPTHEARARTWKLTPRQRAVVEQLLTGATNKEIADALGCAQNTVEEHLTAIYRKAGVGGRHALLSALLSR